MDLVCHPKLEIHSALPNRRARFAGCFILIQILIGTVVQVLGQQFVVAPFNFNVQSGVYKPASTEAAALAKTAAEIAPQTFLPKPHPAMALLFPQPGGILLFTSEKLSDVAGKLLSPSLASVDTIFHNQVYLQKSGDSDRYSFDLRYALQINGKRYYTDFRPHTFLSFRYPLVYHKQLVMLAAQDTGYDMYADKGYPERFHMAVFSMQNGGIKMHFTSDELPFQFGNEFFDDDVVKAEYRADDQTFRIEIKGRHETYRGIWDGNALQQLE